jgi:hypothetical protein
LEGCIHDAENLQEFLIKYKVVPAECIDVATEPTGSEIIQRLHELAIDSHQGKLDFLFLSYSGHGASVVDTTGDEKDGKDECICPSDFQQNGVILDDDLHDLLHAFSRKTKIFIILDACHSGTGVDLAYRYLSRTVCTKERVCLEDFPAVVMISGCADNQTSADAQDETRKETTGACTSAFLDAMQADFETCSSDVFSLLSKMRRGLATKHFTQVPQLNTSFKMNLRDRNHLAFLQNK